MATYRCIVCLAEYVDPQRDGSRYFHVCAPIHNPDYDAQFTTDAEGTRVPSGPLDPDIPEMIERPDARNENVNVRRDSQAAAKELETGREVRK